MLRINNNKHFIHNLVFALRSPLLKIWFYDSAPYTLRQSECTINISSQRIYWKVSQIQDRLSETAASNLSSSVTDWHATRLCSLLRQYGEFSESCLKSFVINNNKGEKNRNIFQNKMKHPCCLLFLFRIWDTETQSMMHNSKLIFPPIHFKLLVTQTKGTPPRFIETN